MSQQAMMTTAASGNMSSRSAHGPTSTPPATTSAPTNTTSPFSSAAALAQAQGTPGSTQPVLSQAAPQSSAAHSSILMSPTLMPNTSSPSSPSTVTTPISPATISTLIKNVHVSHTAAPTSGNASSKTAPILGTLTDGLLWSAVCAIVLVTFTALLTWRSTSLDWPLANLSVPRGVLLLTVLAKFTDWALDGLGKIGWEKLCWGPMLTRSGNLLTHLVMTSGLSGCWNVLCSPPHQRTVTQSRVINLLRRAFLFRWPRFWAFWRIAIWLLVQFPGLIIMSSADTQTAYHPVGWSQVSGGMGIFNASEAFQVPGDFITNSYIFNILQDRTIAYSTEALSSECQNRKTCESMLLVGGLKWISPPPYNWLADADLTAYLTRDMPVYQLEGWNTTFDKSLSWNSDECRVYQAGDAAVQICAKTSSHGGSIAAGIRACDLGKLDDEGDCTLNPVWPGWNTFIAFSSTLDIYRLNVSLAADRRSSTILEVMDKGESIRQDIRPSDFLDAFDNLLCPYVSGNSSISGYCELGRARSDLTLTLWSYIYGGYNSDALESSIAVDTLRNLFATALFLYNPVYRTAVLTSGTVFSRGAEDGIADENHFQGSAARVSSYIAPEFWTVLAFTVSGGFLLAASLTAISLALWFKQPEVSAFGPLNSLKVELVQPAQTGDPDLITFYRDKTDKEALRAAEGLHIKLKQP